MLAVQDAYNIECEMSQLLEFISGVCPDSYASKI
jgi:hypothetical protein